jgi:hypothetical protein
MEDYYYFHKENFEGLEIIKLRYNFDVLSTTKPTRYIRIIYHHSENCKSLKDIFELHYRRYRWGCIGYHFVISKSGKIYYTRDLSHAGAHTKNFNQNSVGVCLIGNFDKEKPSAKQIESFKKLVAVLNEKYNIKETIGHSQAIYRNLQNTYTRIHFPPFNPFKFEDPIDYEIYLKNINETVYKNDPSIKTQSNIAMLKTCPGYYFYKELE